MKVFSNSNSEICKILWGFLRSQFILEFVNMDDLKRTLIKSLFHRMQLFYKVDIYASDPVIALV